jgi:hypothetical protein
MSSISSVTSAYSPYQTTNQNSFAQIIQDFKSIGGALKSGNVSAAQTALSAFQQDLQSNSQTSSTQPFGNNTQANTDYQSLVSGLQSGNLSSAQKAFASLQTDLQTAQTSTKSAHRGHHHHGGGGVSAEALINGLTNNSTTTSATSATSSATSTSGTAANATAENDAPSDGSLLNATA